MADGLVSEMARGYRNPREGMARLAAGGLSEAAAMRDAMIACGVAFVASMPNAVREAARLDIEDPLSGAVAAHLFGYVFVAPLILYALAALLHLAALPFGARGGFLGARAALFRTALLGAPVALAVAVAGAGLEAAAGPAAARWTDPLAVAALVWWLWALSASLAEVEGFGSTLRVASGMAVVCGLAALGLGVLSSGAAGAG